MVGRTETDAEDVELTRAAQAGDSTALGLLLEEHRAGMRAAALTAYDRIAKVCGVPVGTVRSRLNQARAKLTGALAATADRAHGDARTRTGESWGEARHTLAEAASGHFDRVLTQGWSPEVALMNGRTRVGGRDLLARGRGGDLAAGVRQRPVDVAAGRSLTVWEMDLLDPADDPAHCPEAVAWVMTRSGGRVDRCASRTPAAPASSGSTCVRRSWNGI